MQSSVNNTPLTKPVLPQGTDRRELGQIAFDYDHLRQGILLVNDDVHILDMTSLLDIRYTHGNLCSANSVPQSRRLHFPRCLGPSTGFSYNTTSSATVAGVHTPVLVYDEVHEVEVGEFVLVSQVTVTEDPPHLIVSEDFFGDVTYFENHSTNVSMAHVQDSYVGCQAISLAGK